MAFMFFIWFWSGGALYWEGMPPVQAQVTVIGTGDVTTPTATFSVASLLPTPTMTPVPDVQGIVRSNGILLQSDSAPASVDVQAYVTAQPLPTYNVQPGDTALSVALEIGVDVEEIPCLISPAFDLTQPLVIGDILELLPPGTRCHRVGEHDSLQSIAAVYGTTPSAIRQLSWNSLENGSDESIPLAVDTYLRIPPPDSPLREGDDFLGYMLAQPAGTLPLVAYAVGGPGPIKNKSSVPEEWPYGSGDFIWPVYGWVSQGYRHDHRAVDVAAPPGTFVTAADRGVVIRAGWNNQGYGMFVVIDHNIDYISLYSHLDEIFVQEGDVVGQGAVIGTVGSTGNSTGPHLHFEIRDFGQRTNPLELLR